MKLNKPQNDIHAMVIGGHGDTTMIPLHRFVKYNGLSLSKFLENTEIDEIVKSTMVGGATLTKLLGTSAWYAPGASIAYVVDSILNNQNRIIPSSVYLEGEYGVNDICIGVPCIIGKQGVVEIVELDLNQEEKSLFSNSVDAVRKMNESLGEHI
jgi:malate dehydrogenase